MQCLFCLDVLSLCYTSFLFCLDVSSSIYTNIFMALKYRHTQTGIYDALTELLQSQRAIRNKYQQLNELFHQLIEQGTEDAPIQLSGIFAKVDYLVRRFDIPASEALLVHDTRQQLRNVRQLTEEELVNSFPYDVKAVAFLTSRMFSNAPISGVLLSLLPRDNRTHRWAKVDSHVVRCVVEEWTEQYIYAIEEQNGGRVAVCYDASNRYLTREGKADWSYLQKIMRKGSILNLVRVRCEDEVYFPELIIFEPDYLVNVTTIASCFETYAESPFVHLINKLRPQPNSKYIHLGNLSGAFLDDTVHGKHTSFGETWLRFMQQNMLGLLSCNDLKRPESFADFCDEARGQQQNIEQLIGSDLHKLPNFEDYDPKDIVLEPSFFSPVLGIQGRFDFLLESREPSRDRRKTIIIEQKSGKGEYVPPARQAANPDVPVPKEQHLVQLNLYRALFHFEYQKHEGQMEYLMLLYSRYPKGLVSQGSNLPELLLRSIRMRNLLTWCEMHYSEDGMEELCRMSADSLRQKTISDRLWQYVCPQIESVLTPFRSASHLERAYVLRFLKFIAREQLLAKIGSKGREDNGFAAKWQCTLDEKIATGDIYDRLDISEYLYDDDGKTIVAVRFSLPEEIQNQNFRRGDIVLFYTYTSGMNPEAWSQMALRGSIVDITSHHLTIALRNPQADERALMTGKNQHWAVEHDLYDSASSALYSSMFSFLSATKRRRDLVLGLRMPEVDEDIEVKGNTYGAFHELVLHAKQSRDIFMVIGPPGTGKTSYGLLYQLQEQLLEEDTNVLLLSYTNRAVDEMCSKLLENGIDFIRLGSELTCEPAYHRFLFSTLASKCKKGKEMAELIRTTKVFCGTTSAFSAHPEIFSLKKFELAIVDEASQILEPHLIGLLSAKHGDDDAILKFVLIGDHKQLPAVVQQSPEESKVTDEALVSMGLTNCRNSFFERLLQRFKTENGYDARYVYMLTRQGRMHRDIAEFANQSFYEGKLDVVPLEHQLLPPEAVLMSGHSSYESEPVVYLDSVDGNNLVKTVLAQHRLSFVAVPAPDDSHSPKVNTVEADIIALFVKHIYEKTEQTFSVDKTVGIIVPYRNQISTVRNSIDKFGIEELHDITIDTVERYQGSQRDYIIYGFTVQQAYQLNFLTSQTFEEGDVIIDRKLNVAMTRARLNLVMVGNPQILNKDTVFRRLIDFAKSKGSYFPMKP